MTPKFCVKHFISFTLCFSMFLKENNGFSKSLEIYILSLLLEECKLCINYCLITWKRRLVSSSVINSSLLAILSSHKLSSILYSNKLYCLIYKYNLKSAGSKPFIFLTFIDKIRQPELVAINLFLCFPNQNQNGEMYAQKLIS